MKTRSCIRTGFALIAAVILAAALPAIARGEEGQDPPPPPHTQTLGNYASQVNSILPQYSGAMLDVPDGPDWIAGVTLPRLAASVSESMPDTIATDGPVTIGYGGPKWMKIDYSEGFIRYTNRDRCFQPDSPCTAIPEGSAQSGLYSTLGTLGCPSGEAGDVAVDLVSERSVDGETSQPQESTCEVERLVTLERKVGGTYPVFGSIARMAVSNLYQRARLLIRWPQFALEDGLLMRTRAEVVTEIAARILQAQKDESGLGTPVEVDIRVGFLDTPAGYVPAAEVGFIDTYYRDAGVIISVPLAYNPTSGAGPDAGRPELQLRASFDLAGEAALVDYYLPRAGAARLSIVDVSGREVVTLAEGRLETGWRQARWDLRYRNGTRAASGVYFVVLRAEGAQAAKKILVVQ